MTLKEIEKININDPNLLETISKKYESKIVGENENIKTLVCSIVSKDLPKELRFSIIILNQSTTGKSYFLNNVLQPLQSSGDIIDFTDFTEAYFKRAHDNVNGKIIKIEQLERKDDMGRLTFERLKHLQTEGRLRFGNVESNEKGKRAPIEFEIVGIPVILTTATSSNIDPETENRFFIMGLDESEKQTDKIIDYDLDRVSTINPDQKWQNNIIQLEEIYKELKHAAHVVEDVKIPFSHKIKNFLPRILSIRRDLLKILGLTCVLAFIHYKNRDRLMNKEAEHLPTSTYGDTEELHKAVIIARPDDLKQAIEIAGNTIIQTLNKATHKTMELNAVLKKLYTEKNTAIAKPEAYEGVTVADLQKTTGWPETTVRDHLRTLTENGFVLANYEEKPYRFHSLEKKFSDFKITNMLFSDREYQDWINKTLEEYGAGYAFVPSRKSEE